MIQNKESDPHVASETAENGEFRNNSDWICQVRMLILFPLDYVNIVLAPERSFFQCSLSFICLSLSLCHVSLLRAIRLVNVVHVDLINLMAV
jgi:hypothetical protein